MTTNVILLTITLATNACSPKQTVESRTVVISNETTNAITISIPGKIVSLRDRSGLPENVRIKTDGSDFIWVDTNPNRLWDTTLKFYGQYEKFKTYDECLKSAKAYVAEMNKDLAEALEKEAMKKWPEVP